MYAPAWEGAAEFDAAQPFPVGAPPHLADAARAVGGAPGGADLLEARRLRHGAVRRGGAARPARAVAAPGGRAAAGRHHPRARGGLGGAARRTQPAAPHRRFRGHGHLPGRVHPGAAGPGAVPGGGGPDGPARARRGHRARSTPGAGGAAVRERLGLGRPAGGGLRVAAGAAQGPGHADPGLAAGPARRCRTPRCCWSADGPYRSRLRRLASASSGWTARSCSPGAVPWPSCPPTYDAGDVFAMPCRTRRRGLDVEGLGIVYLEASATGLPVVGGDSGNAPDAIRDGETGYVVPGAQRGGRGGPAGAPAHRPGRRPGPWAKRAWPGWTRNGAGTSSRSGFAEILGRGRGPGRGARPRPPVRRRAPRSRPRSP